jgi:GTP-binding protein Era
VLTRPGAQILLLDTPGLHEGGKRLNRLLNAIAEEVAQDCDVALLLVDPRAGWDAGHAALRERLRTQGARVLVAATQCDLPEAAAAAASLPADLCISARTGRNTEALVDALVALLPEGPPFYPEDQLTDRPLRFLAAERVREAVFEEVGQEVPYATAVEVEAFDESRPDLVRIRARLLVERESQKAILVGRGGAMIRRIGTRARREIEGLLGSRVFLDLRVKAEPGWSRRPRRLRALGYH